MKTRSIPVLALALVPITAPLMAVSPAALAAQTMVQPLPGTTDADALVDQMRRLAVNPQDVVALVTAGELSLKLDDISGAASLFARAEKADPRNGRVKAGEASLFVRTERPGEALRYFAQAESLGYPATRFAGDRALAYDLLGQQDRAQRDYRLALKGTSDSETTRRYALSLGISGRREQALQQLDPLLKRQDRAAWRARAFVLAMDGDVTGASRIATTMMPPGMAQGLQPFFERLPNLPATDRAFAVHFGEIRPTAERMADARLAPSLTPLAPEPGAPVQFAVRQVAPVEVRKDKRRDRRDRRDDVQLAAVVPARTVSARAVPVVAKSAAIVSPQAGAVAMPALARPKALGATPPSRTLAAMPSSDNRRMRVYRYTPPGSLISEFYTVPEKRSAPVRVVSRASSVELASVQIPAGTSARATPVTTQVTSVPTPVAPPAISVAPALGSVAPATQARPSIVPFAAAQERSAIGAPSMVTSERPPIVVNPAQTLPIVPVVVTPAPVSPTPDRTPMMAVVAPQTIASPMSKTQSMLSLASTPSATPPSDATAEATPPVEVATVAKPGFTSLADAPAPISANIVPIAIAAKGSVADTVPAKIVANLPVPAQEVSVRPPAATRKRATRQPIVEKNIAQVASTDPVAKTGTRGGRRGLPAIEQPVDALKSKKPDRRGSRQQIAAVDLRDADPRDDVTLTRAERRAALRKASRTGGVVTEAESGTKRKGGRVVAGDDVAPDVALTPAEKRAAAREARMGKRAVGDKQAGGDRKAVAKQALADKLADREAAAEKKAAKSNPERIWVQVAGGAYAGDLAKAYAGVKAKAPAAFAAHGAYKTPLRATNRVLTGPFKTDAEARAFVNQLAKKGVSAFTFSSDKGQKVERLDTKSDK